MRDSSELQLAFVLEKDLAEIVLAAKVSPSDEHASAAFLTFDDGTALIKVIGRTREAVFNVARRMLLPAAAKVRGRTIDAVLKTPGRTTRDAIEQSAGQVIALHGPPLRSSPGAADGITIVLGAEVAFAFTRMRVDTGRQEAVNHETFAPSPELAPR